jgi:CRISPR-associated protein Cmr1
MPSITFDLETVTPLFLAGADQTIAELRPPAFRGALRYWFRAIASSVAPFNEVKQWENKVFGSTDSGGAVIIRVQSEQLTSSKVLKRGQDSPGLAYLYFSAYKGSGKEARGCFPPDEPVKIVLQTRFPSPENLQYLRLASGAMWALINLGGIGSRSNRGAGNLRLKAYKTDATETSSIPFKVRANNLTELSSKISNGIGVVKKIYREIFSQTYSFNSASSEFDILDANVSDLYLWQPEYSEYTEEWDYILDALGTKYQEFRSRYKNARDDDYPQVKEWIRTKGGSSVNTVKRAAFGLPIQFYFTSLPKPNNKASLEANQKINRSSSPLHFKVVPLNDESFAILIIHFKTSLLPANAKLVLKNSQGRTQCSVPTQSIITEFIATLNTCKVSLP